MESGCFNFETLRIILLFLVIKIYSRNYFFGIKFFYQQDILRIKPLCHFLVRNFIVTVVVDDQYPVIGFKTAQVNSFFLGA